MSKRLRGGRDGPGSQGLPRAMERGRPQQEQDLELERRPHEKQRLYLILDDDPLGYSIREIKLSTRFSCQTRSSSKNTAIPGKVAVERLPDPIFRVEAPRGMPLTFSAIGTRILMMQCLNSRRDSIMPVFDVRRRGITFGPGILCQDRPIYIPMGAEVFALDTCRCMKLCFEPQWPLDSCQHRDPVPWSWHQLPLPPFDMVDVTSYAMHPDGPTIVVSTDVWPGDSCSAAGTFTFDTRKGVWESHGDSSLPFTGRAYFVPCLDAFVGLSKDQATLGQLVYLRMATRPPLFGKDEKPLFVKEKLLSDDPAETYVSATLVYTGRGGGSRFCLVQCVKVKLEPGNGNADDEDLKEPQPCYCYRYHLTTFSLSFDGNGDLTTGGTSWVRCYKVPRETTQRFIDCGNPVAFWL